jgi:ribosomal protein L24
MHVKKGDEVLVISGKEKGKKGTIKQSIPTDSRVVVEGLNKVKRHTRPRGVGQMGGIVEQEAPLQVWARITHGSSLSRGSRRQGACQKGTLLQVV